MEFEWDEGKDAVNRAKHGVSLEGISAFDWQTANVFADDREDIGEERQIARGMIGERLFVAVFVLRGDTTRLMSLRKENRRERALYATEIRTGLRRG